MKSLVEVIRNLGAIEAPKGTKKNLTPLKAKIEEPMHVPGYGVVSKKQLHLLPQELQDQARPTSMYEEALDENMGGTNHRGAVVTNNKRTEVEPGWKSPEERQKEKFLADIKKRKEAAQKPVTKEETELDEKWINHPDKPAEGLNRNQTVSVKATMGKTIFGKYLRTDEKTKKHLVMHNHDKSLHWHEPETVFHDMSDYAHSEFVKEANEGTDHITMTVPLFIRCLEWAHEEAKDDVELHKFVEKVVAKGGVLSTEDYEELL
jgi:hypothetical protein